MLNRLANLQGILSSWWTRIVVGILIFVFIFLQSLFNQHTPAKLKTVNIPKNSPHRSLRKI
ncbi:MAG: hypothetical protein N2Z76_07305 [Treponemataceae bacterium]|nr:hypothetical protein [Treponemataceae bacterium]